MSPASSECAYLIQQEETELTEFFLMEHFPSLFPPVKFFGRGHRAAARLMTFRTN